MQREREIERERGQGQGQGQFISVLLINARRGSNKVHRVADKQGNGQKLKFEIYGG